MNYIAYKSDGTYILVDSNTVDVSTSLSLSGINYNASYDSTFWINIVHLLENFSSPYEPYAPISGQLWFDNLHQRLFVYDGTAWVNLSPPTEDLSLYVTPGGTLSGNLVLRNPSSAKSIANRSYVDSLTVSMKQDIGATSYVVLDNKYTVIQTILSNNDKEVLLPVTMSDSRYSVLCTPNSTSSSENNVNYTIYNKTPTGFKISSSDVFDTLACVITGFAL